VYADFGSLADLSLHSQAAKESLSIRRSSGADVVMRSIYLILARYHRGYVYFYTLPWSHHSQTTSDTPMRLAAAKKL